LPGETYDQALQRHALENQANQQLLDTSAALLGAGAPSRAPAGAFYLQGANPPGTTCDIYGRCR
jgi:hypothetical protein